MAQLSVVVPVYNESAGLAELHRRLGAALAAITGDYEVVLVDDGSSDGSWPAITGLGRADPRVKGLRFSRNFGQHYAITAGLDHCDGDWVVVMDSDLQDRPEEIARLYAKAQEGFDIVLARRGRRRDPLAKRFTAWLFFRLFNWLSGMSYDREAGNFRIMSRRVVVATRTVRDQLRFLGGIVDWLGFPRSSVPVEHDRRFAGRGAYTLRRQWKLARDMMLAYSDKPLVLAVRLGLLVTLVGLAGGVYAVARALAHHAHIAGWGSLIASVFFLSGIIITVLGVTGVYLNRSFAEARDRPLYVVSDRLGL